MKKNIEKELEKRSKASHLWSILIVLNALFVASFSEIYSWLLFLLSEVKGKDVTEITASGREKLASVQSGGCSGAAVAAATGEVAPAQMAAESKKAEKAEGTKDSEDDYDSGFSLF
uniref:60S acidic ribosomal protein P2 n=1 Tax=Kalanchoe fedtschenkoi TaxID=63787 RepID=A0A7N0UC84_KALFE